MRAFFAMIWNDRDEKAAREATLLKARISKVLGADPDRVEAGGFTLYDLDSGRRSILPLEDDEGHCVGAVYGTLFDSGNLSPSTRPLRRLDPAAARKLHASEGASLLHDYWGSYVAFVATRAGFAVIADPTSAIPCFVYKRDAVTLVFSHLERCLFVDRRGFTVNEAFVARLLAYDKIQNGETGLNEVRELLGGERLRIPCSGRPPELLWDPRRIALGIHEPGVNQAAEELRHVTRSVVGAWAHGYDGVSLNLSGGLDSSIVLACLSHSCLIGAINAVHSRLDSSDAREDRYAKAMADYVACDLVEVLESSARAIPDIGAHPPTVRPYRSFIGQDLATRMGDQEGRVKRVLFTGQGGDHLFLQKPGALIFADHLRYHGLSRASGAQLLDAARLSERSIWAVLRESLPYVAGKIHRNGIVAGIEARRTAINHRAFDNIAIKDSLPVWTRTSEGLPPAKFDQIGGLSHMIHVREPLDKAGGRDTVHPLISQPLIELCLRLPTYLLCAQGRSRGLARLAFVDDLPELVRMRASKGSASRFFLAYLGANSRAIVDALRDGELVTRGLIARAEVEAFMNRNDHQIQAFGRMMLLYYAVEAWLRAWKLTAHASSPLSNDA